MHVTLHARKRLRERIKLSHPAAERLARRAFERGLHIDDTRGRLHIALSEKIERHGKGHATRIYGGHVWIFEGEVLITAFALPGHLRAMAHKQLRRAK